MNGVEREFRIELFVRFATLIRVHFEGSLAFFHPAGFFVCQRRRAANMNEPSCKLGV